MQVSLWDIRHWSFSMNNTIFWAITEKSWRHYNERCNVDLTSLQREARRHCLRATCWPPCRSCWGAQKVTLWAYFVTRLKIQYDLSAQLDIMLMWLRSEPSEVNHIATGSSTVTADSGQPGGWPWRCLGSPDVTFTRGKIRKCKGKINKHR